MANFQQYNVYDGLTSCKVVATSNQSGTYFNGLLNNGLGATFTYANGALSIDGVSIVAGDRVLFVAQTSGFQNGIYFCTATGASGVPAVLVRAADFQSVEQMKAGQYVPIAQGSVFAGTIWTLNGPLPVSLGVSNISFANNYLFAGFPSPDINANLILFQTQIPNSIIVSGATIFTPPGNNLYILMGMSATVTNSFSGGANNSNVIIDAGNVDVVTITSALLKSSANYYWIGQSGFTASNFSASSSINSSTPLSVKAQPASDYASGILNLATYLIRVS